MFRYFVKRLLASVPLLLAVLTVSFFLVRLSPGSPFQREAELPEEVRASMEAAYGFDRPLPEQYVRYLGAALRGDFGTSFMYKDKPVHEIIAEALPVSARVGLLAMGFSIVVGVALGLLSAVKQNSLLDYVTMTGIMAGKSIPPMVLAPLFVGVFALGLGWLPVAGWNDGAALHLVGPVVCLGLYDVAAIARLSRASLLEVIRNRYIQTARAKGLPEWRVVLGHALREALCPLVTYLGPALSSILIGTVVVEQVFNIPGLGRYLVAAATNRDYTLVLGITTVACLFVVAFNILSDLALAWLDPRIRVQ